MPVAALHDSHRNLPALEAVPHMIRRAERRPRSAVRAASHPHAEKRAARNALRAPSETEMLEALRRAEL